MAANLSEMMIPPPHPHRPTAVKLSIAKAIVIAVCLLAGAVGLVAFVASLPAPAEPEVKKDSIWVVWSVKHNYGRLAWLKSQTAFTSRWECEAQAQELSKHGTLSECRNEFVRR